MSEIRRPRAHASKSGAASGQLLTMLCLAGLAAILERFLVLVLDDGMVSWALAILSILPFLQIVPLQRVADRRRS